MKSLRLAVMAVLAGGLMTAAATGQDTTVRRTALESDFDNFVVAQAPAASPSDRAPGVPGVPAATAAAPVEEVVCDDEAEFRLFNSERLEARRITIRGWVDQGFTWNPDSPANRFNGPVAYNDRSNEYQLNQAYLYAERLTDTEERRIDLGGRIDLLYGTDHRFPTAFGLDDDWTNHRFYGLGMPQAYGDVAFGDWVWRTGHMLAPVGYESVMAPENFFYSHSYQFLYAQPTTVTSSMLTRKLNDNLSAYAGVFNGWNNFEWRDNEKLGFYGGVNWKLPNEKTTVALQGFFNNEQPTGIESSRSLVVFVVTHNFNDKLQYVLESDIGYDSNAVVDGNQNRTHGEWYGMTHYLFYKINPCWALGARFDWFADDDGMMVRGLGDPQGINLNGVATQWSALSCGVRYTPNNNVIVRSELRWDWNRPLIETNDYPFDDYTQGSQFLWGTDLIIKF